MDERDTVPRREAVVGLSLLGLFSLALTGTLTYRIVYPTKYVPPKVVLNEWKSQAPLPDDPSELFGPHTDASQLATQDFPAVDPIPTTAEQSSSVPASAIREVELPPPAAVPASAEAPLAAPTPTFVAPSYR